MHHKKSKPKPIHSPKLKTKKCLLCCSNTAGKILNKVQLAKINRKYLQDAINAGFSCVIDNFMDGKLKIFPGGYNEFMKQYDGTPTLHTYYTLTKTIEKITQVINEAIPSSNPTPMIFSNNHYHILLRHHKKQQNIFKQKTKYKCSEDIGKSTEACEIKVLKNSKEKKKIKSNNKSTNRHIYMKD